MAYSLRITAATILLIFFNGRPPTVAIAQNTMDNSQEIVSTLPLQHGAQTANVMPRQLAVVVTCDVARKDVASPDFGSLSSEDRDQALITIADCATVEHNQAHPDDPQAVVISADPSAQGDKIFFKTISINQVLQVHEVCRKVGQATFAFLGVANNVTPPVKVLVGAADVVSNHGGVECDAYMHALQKDNPMVIFAPSIIVGVAITVKVLDMIGAKKPAVEIQKEVDRVGQQAGNSLVQSVNEIKQHPLILLAAPAAPLLLLANAAHVKGPTVHLSCKLQVKCEIKHLKPSCHNMCS